MALTRAFLKGMNLTEEQVGAIVEAHTDTVNALKSERDAFKAEAEKVPELQRQIESLQEQDIDDWQGKYEQEHKDFEQYKKDMVAKEEAAKVEVAYRKLLADNHVGETHIDSIIGVTDLKSMAIGEDGKIVDHLFTAKSLTRPRQLRILRLSGQDLWLALVLRVLAWTTLLLVMGQ